MTSYLLLRNNKESGPYSLEELVGQGLKPYDLVWVNGKSAAWRYPGEVTELIPYAPMVEEQPFDRFYKKQEEKPAEHSTITQKEIPTQKQEQVPQQEEIPAQPAYVPKKSVFVTMPGQKQQQPVNKTEQIQPKKEQQQEHNQQYQQYQPRLEESDQSHLTQTITIKENPVAAEIKYSQSLDDIKEMYVRTLQERKQRLVNKSMLLKFGKNAAIILAIAGVGVIVGFSLKNRSAKEVVSNAAAVQPVANPPAADTTSTLNLMQAPPQEQSVDPRTIPVEKVYEEILLRKEEEKADPPVIEQKQQPIDEPELKETTAKATTKKEPATDGKPIIDPTYPAADLDPRTGERSRKMRETDNSTASNPGNETDNSSAPTSKKEQSKTTMKKSGGSLSKQVSVNSNNYQVVAFGGIRNLHLTVTNDSKYMLDNVVVELNYLKPSEQPLKTQNIEFRNVSPGGSMTIRVPDTNRGIKISYRILNILSVQSQKELADL